MKIITTTTKIECTAEELRQSNSVADGFMNVLRKAFNGTAPQADNYYDDEDDEDESDV